MQKKKIYIYKSKKEREEAREKCLLVPGDTWPTMKLQLLFTWCSMKLKTNIKSYCPRLIYHQNTIEVKTVGAVTRSQEEEEEEEDEEGKAWTQKKEKASTESRVKQPLAI